MKTGFEKIIDKLNEGYEIVRSENTHRQTPNKIVILYTVLKVEDETTKSIFCEVAFNVVKMLMKETGCKVRKEPKQNNCLIISRNQFQTIASAGLIKINNLI